MGLAIPHASGHGVALDINSIWRARSVSSRASKLENTTGSRNVKWLIGLLVTMMWFHVALAAVDLTPEQQERAQELYRQIRCPVCEAQPIRESDASLSFAMRDVIAQEIADGKTDAEILTSLTQTYGDDIRLLPKAEPRTLPLWLAPWLVSLLGAGGIMITRYFKTQRNV